jgi:LL-diaminopimelate aminotransferase
MKFASRVDALKPYPFARQAEIISRLREKGVDVIRLDIGSPDLPPAPHIVSALEQSARQAETHGYPPMNGTTGFLEAASAYYQSRFGVDLNPQSEITTLLGSKEGIFNLSQVMLEPGSVALVPDPGYPVYRVSAEWSGAEVFPLPLRKENRFLPDLTTIPPSILARSRLLWLNYPNNPTGAIAEKAFLESAVAFARKHQLLVCHDAAYCDVAFEGYRPASILECEGAQEVAVEFYSLSKSYNMAGWRVGMLVGNARVVAGLRKVKSNIDSGVFIPLMAAGEAALRGQQDWVLERNAIYAMRSKLLLSAIQAAGLKAEPPKASLYIWAETPQGIPAEAYAMSLLEATGVCVAPGTFFGECGEGFIRIALGISDDRLMEAATRWRGWDGCSAFSIKG